MMDADLNSSNSEHVRRASGWAANSWKVAPVNAASTVNRMKWPA